jgi:hypothetical protein
MIETFKAGWDEIWASFHGSETILWSRLKTTVGGILMAVAMSGADLSAWLSPKWLVVWQIFAAWLMVDGLSSEWFRKRRADDIERPHSARALEDNAENF